ncbi:ribonuclease H-like domain-containing protein, partial [uncultured Lamprocystis sp.]|uniref:ribonuclease H-like domain-containing protein n=1 Tax=uncultured Lamprocystis sp. TaxID=543132 RepID=UPI0025E1A2AE
AERLRRVGVGRTADRTPVGMPDEGVLANTLGAECLAPGVLRLERRLSSGRGHGRVPPAGMTAWGELPWGEAGQDGGGGLEARVAGAWLCLDTETSGLAGGTGTWAFLTGLLRADGREWLLRQYLLTRLDAEPVYLDLLAAELTRPAALLTYNGRAFDAPLLATRFRLANRTDPLAGLPHLDLLGPTRRAFARRWPDCRLVTAESRLLGFQRSGDLPGAAAPAAWLGWLRRGETAPLAAVLRHNRDDLLSLAGLLPALAGVYRDPAAHGADCRTVAAAWQRRDPARALRILAANRQDLDAAGLHDLARLYRRGGDWVQASGIWEALAARGDATARAALARYCEHHRGDLTRALALAESLPPGPERERRQARLRVKLGRERPAGQIELAIEPYSTGT